MKQTKTCTIDEMGRILIPKELRDMLGAEIGDKVDMYYVDGNTAILQLSKCSDCKNEQDKKVSSKKP